MSSAHVNTRCGSGSIRTRRQRAISRRRMWCKHCRSRMCKSQRESSAHRRCQRGQLHFNTRSARKAGSPMKRSSAKSLLRLGPTEKSLACAISRGSSSPVVTTRLTAGSAENRRQQLPFSNFQARTRWPLPMRCGRRWLSSSRASRRGLTTQLSTIRRCRSASQSRKFRRRSLRPSRWSFWLCLFFSKPGARRSFPSSRFQFP